MPRGMIALQGLNVDLGKSINEGLALREKYDQWKAKKGYEADIAAADQQYQNTIAANESVGKVKDAYAQGDMAKADDALVDAVYDQWKAGKFTNNVAIDPTTGQIKRTELATPTQDGKWKMNDAALPTTSQLSAENRRALDYQKALSRYHMGVGDVKNAAAAKQQEERLAWRHGWTELDNDRPALLRKLAPYAALAMGDGSTFKVNDDGSVLRVTPDGKATPFELNEAQLQQFKMQAMAYDAISRFGEFDFLKNLTDLDKSRAAINESNAKVGYYKAKSQPEPKVYPFGINGASLTDFDMIDENGNKIPGKAAFDANGNQIGRTRLSFGGVVIPEYLTDEEVRAYMEEARKEGFTKVTSVSPDGKTLVLGHVHTEIPTLAFTIDEIRRGEHKEALASALAKKEGAAQSKQAVPANPVAAEQTVQNAAAPQQARAKKAIAGIPAVPSDEDPFGSTRQRPMFVAPGEAKPVVPGNIDLANRPQVKLKDGSTATVRSMSFNIDGKEVLLPTVTEDGRVISPKEAIAKFKKDKKHLGIFDTPEQATAYAEQLHKQQEDMYVKPRKYMTYDEDPTQVVAAPRQAIPARIAKPSMTTVADKPNAALAHYRTDASKGTDMRKVFGRDAAKFKLKNGATPEYNDPNAAARSGSVAMKANNPLNLRASTSAFNGQIGEYRAGKNGRFAVFKDQKHGLRAGTLNIFTQMQRLSGKNSLKDAEIPLGDLIYRYAPPSENDTQRYLQNVMKSMGVDFYKMQSDMIKFNPQFKRKDSMARVREVANAVKLDPRNKQQMAALVNAIAKQEDHKQKLLPEDIDWAIESALMEKYRQGAFGKDASYDVGE